MKNIGIFCDGTWQHLDQPHPTNIALLAGATASVSTPEAGSISQVLRYDDGVGVSEGVLGPATRILGGALGKGLDYKVVRSYTFLALNYDPGDRVFIFGFSRGAYTARSLAGLIRWLGILKRENAGEAFHAMALYRTRPAKAETAEQQAADLAAFEARTAPFRAAYSHHSGAFTAPKAYEPGRPESLTPDADCAWIQYVGVFDTVGALGIPSNLPFAAEFDAKYGFYDTSLSSAVRSARHAVAIDERRESYPPTLWDNIGDLNTHAQSDALAYDQRPYQQSWFPGGHGLVGGGGEDGGISLAPFAWIAEGAARAGWGFEPGRLKALADQANPLVPFPRDGFGFTQFLYEAIGMADRLGPDLLEEVSAPARERYLRFPGGYDPPPLRRSDPVRTGLAALRA